MQSLNPFKKVLLETIGLSTARGRLIFFVVLSVVVFLMPPRWPVTFSVWQRLHVPSPSIGLTRAYRHLLHGDVRAAWQQNKLIFAVVAIGGLVLLKDTAYIIKTARNSTGGNAAKS